MTNWKLLAPLRAEPKRGLEKVRRRPPRDPAAARPPNSHAARVQVRDYRAVNADVWRVFVANHGGGPPLRRREINIYAPPVPVGGEAHVF